MTSNTMEASPNVIVALVIPPSPSHLSSDAFSFPRCSVLTLFLLLPLLPTASVGVSSLENLREIVFLMPFSLFYLPSSFPSIFFVILLFLLPLLSDSLQRWDEFCLQLLRLASSISGLVQTADSQGGNDH